MRKNIIIALLLFSCQLSFSQHEASSWLFNTAMQIDFTEDTAILDHKRFEPPFWYTNMPMNTSCISDSNGQFLFATNSVCIYNANNDSMPNGDLLGDKHTGQSIIVPRPESNGHYYIFTVGRYYSMTDFRYSEIDMSLDSGMGDVVSSQSNILLQTGITDKVTAVRHANGKDIWVVSHENNNNRYVSYLVTKNGINTTPVETNIGTVIEDTPPFNLHDAACQGTIKCSPCGRKLAIASKGLNMIQLVDFDTETGIPTNPLQLSVPYAYNLEFSADGNMLYCSSEFAWLQTNDTMRIFQFNLLEDSNAAIINSMYRVNAPQNYPEATRRIPLQLAIDDNIYSFYHMSGSPITPLGIIKAPHLPDNACNYDIDTLMPYTTNNSVFNGLPNFMTSYLDKNIFATTVCLGDTIMFHTRNSYLFDSIRWEITDPLTGLHAYSNQDTVYHLYSQPGSYAIHCFRYRGQYIDDFVKKVQVQPYVQFVGKDTTICIGEEVSLSLMGNIGSVNWYDQYDNWVYTGNQLIVSQEGSYYPTYSTYWQVCGDELDTVSVEVIDINLSFGTDTLSGNCITDQYTYYPSGYWSHVESFLWNTGYTGYSLQAPTPGMYVLTASGYGCSDTDSIYVSYEDSLVVDLGIDQSFCDMNSFQLSLPANADNYLWFPFGDTTQEINASVSGTYIGMASNACGSFTDTVQLQFLNYPSVLSVLDTSFCAGDSVSINASQDNCTYQWSNGNSDSLSYFSSPGVYSVTVSNECGDATSSFSLTEEFPLLLDLIDTVWLNNDSILIEPMLEGSYLWSTGSTENYIWLSDTGIYTLSVWNNCGEVSDTITVLSSLGVSTPHLSELSVYPNPARNSIIIGVSTDMIGAELRIYSIFGKLIYSSKLENEQSKISLDKHAQGNYLIKIESDAKVFTRKLIKL